jgi:imidazole glycerol-phosphate synthase subunit HisF
MITKRIIPCLDILGGRTVKGVNFIDLIDAGDPIELATLYSKKGADELVFLDISATEQQRDAFEPLVYDVAKKLSIPFTVGGGISSTEKVARLLHNGADKVSINSSAVNDPKLIGKIANTYGSQCLIVAVDAKREEGEWWVYTTGGKVRTRYTLLSWAIECQERGAGELLFTSMDHDGTKNGFANDMLAVLAETLSIPIIASGGAGTPTHFKDVFLKGKADAALAASVFHFSEIEIASLKRFLADSQIPVRL